MAIEPHLDRHCLQLYVPNFLLSPKLSVAPKVFTSFFQTLRKDFSHIEDLHLVFCAHFMNIFSFLRGVVLKTFFRSKCLGGVLFM